MPGQIFDARFPLRLRRVARFDEIPGIVLGDQCRPGIDECRQRRKRILRPVHLE
jgi:hypothetical protein